MGVIFPGLDRLELGQGRGRGARGMNGDDGLFEVGAAVVLQAGLEGEDHLVLVWSGLGDAIRSGEVAAVFGEAVDGGGEEQDHESGAGQGRPQEAQRFHKSSL